MQIYLPIAEMSVPVEAIMVLGMVAGFFTSVFGVGGGFLTTPFLIFLGVPPSISVGTQANQLVASSVSGSLIHWSRGNIDVKLGFVMLGGSVVGSLIGIGLFKILQHIGQIDAAINLLYILFLGSIGSMMLVESIYALLKKQTAEKGRSKLWVMLGEKLPYKMHFPKSKMYISACMPAGIGFLGGVVTSLMGVGGGFFMVPAMIYILGMSTIMVAGTSLFQIMFTTIFSTILHAVANHTVDLVLAVILIIGGILGSQIGVRAAKYIRGAPARLMLAAMLIAVAGKLASDLLIQPYELFAMQVR
ncbi:MAG: permease [Micavibrio aeruginosavorus]|uniref:Probable membrane transporter protein n=1 Tax=Micavibrio aeruginosavorus TaxID=349221 RepID=A0A2W5HP34_9BACT|nr:MAG: permease [Micavibrio aeruginosavorus]